MGRIGRRTPRTATATALTAALTLTLAAASEARPADPAPASPVYFRGVGGDGHTVTPVQWARRGDLSDVPAPAFKRTARTAVAKLY